MTPSSPKPFSTRICSECGMEVVNHEPYTTAHAERCSGAPEDDRYEEEE